MKNKDTMKKKFVLCLAMLMVWVVGMARISDNLLPKPQQMITMGGSFQMGKVVLSTPVLQTEWEELIAQAGGTIVPIIFCLENCMPLSSLGLLQ